jgi:hypothetical protein
MSDRVIVTRPIVGIAHMQVCAAADATDEEILAECNRENPSGTTHGWSTVCRGDDEFWGKTAQVPCQSNPARIHFLVAC